MSACQCGLIFYGTTPGVVFAGTQLKKYEFSDRNDVRMEVRCNRPDPHPEAGEHWFSCDQAKIIWTISPDVFWRAESNTPK